MTEEQIDPELTAAINDLTAAINDAAATYRAREVDSETNYVKGEISLKKHHEEVLEASRDLSSGVTSILTRFIVRRLVANAVEKVMKDGLL